MGDNLKNFLIASIVPLPSLIFYLFLFHDNSHNYPSSADLLINNNSTSTLWNWFYHLHPLLLANILFFLNVNLLFWLIALVQSSHWMIDLYWTVIPVLLVHFYADHPSAQYNLWRSWVVILLTWVWSIRLTHSYFRREKWQWGAREDWRFTDMRLQYGHNWWWVSFFAVYLAQQSFISFDVSNTICLNDQPHNIWDFLAIIVCLSGIFVAYFADTQLHDFVRKNNKQKELGKPMVPNLDKGLWYYSRHPNYFGEQLWWWGLGIFGWNLGSGWTFVGALINSMCLAYVTMLVENRILKQNYRAEAYQLYQKTTSVWIPWFKSYPQGKIDKNKNA